MSRLYDVLDSIASRITTYDITTYTDLLSYTSWQNAFTCPSDGYVFVYNGSGTGFVSIHNVAGIGGTSNSRETTFVRKGTKLYVSGSVSAARFFPLP